MKLKIVSRDKEICNEVEISNATDEIIKTKSNLDYLWVGINNRCLLIIEDEDLNNLKIMCEQALVIRAKNLKEKEKEKEK